jgi:hypothetical protein
MEIAPAIQMSTPQDTADGGWAETRTVGDLISRAMLAAECDDLRCQGRGSGARSAPWARRAVQQTRPPLAQETAPPFGHGLGRHSKDDGRLLAAHARAYDFNQRLSTAQGESGILMDVHLICPRKLDCSSQSASLVPIEWTTS